MYNEIVDDTSLTSNPPLWPPFCSLQYNDLDSATEDAIRAAWGDRGGMLGLRQVRPDSYYDTCTV